MRSSEETGPIHYDIHYKCVCVPTTHFDSMSFCQLFGAEKYSYLGEYLLFYQRLSCYRTSYIDYIRECAIIMILSRWLVNKKMQDNTIIIPLICIMNVFCAAFLICVVKIIPISTYRQLPTESIDIEKNNYTRKRRKPRSIKWLRRSLIKWGTSANTCTAQPIGWENEGLS
ncbi:hypothetical protein QTP88_021979 [Uroleucon formosanum]